jgi:hypothetical protein
MLQIFAVAYLTLSCLSGIVMLGRPVKLARLQALRSKLPHMSQTALAALLAEAEREPLPTAVNRKHIRHAREQVTQSQTPYGTLHQTLKLELSSGDTVDCEIQHPFAMLYYACCNSDRFSEFIRGVAAAHPPTVDSPWQIIVYTDEILPGNQLAYKSSRKTWGVYWSILQFGMSVLSDEVLDVVVCC